MANLPKPGIYANIVEECPHCRGASRSGLVIASETSPSKGISGCPVCGGAGIVVGLVPLDVAVLSILDALGILTESDKKRMAKRIEQLTRGMKESVLSLSDEVELVEEDKTEKN